MLDNMAEYMQFSNSIRNIFKGRIGDGNKLLQIHKKKSILKNHLLNRAAKTLLFLRQFCCLYMFGWCERDRSTWYNWCPEQRRMHSLHSFRCLLNINDVCLRPYAFFLLHNNNIGVLKALNFIHLGYRTYKYMRPMRIRCSRFVSKYKFINQCGYSKCKKEEKKS